VTGAGAVPAIGNRKAYAGASRAAWLRIEGNRLLNRGSAGDPHGREPRRPDHRYHRRPQRRVEAAVRTGAAGRAYRRLCGYAVWRLLDAIADSDHHGISAGGLVARIGNAIRGCIYGALGIDAIQLLRGLGRRGGDDAEMWTARVLAAPLGEAAISIAGIAMAIYGASEFVQSLRGRLDPKVDWSSIPSDIRPAVQKISRFGVGIRAGLITTLGVFLVRAALSGDAEQAAGSRESMLRLGGLVEGRWFLALIAAGVLAYALDQAVHARYRRIRPVV
jgi:hypothetical protein